MKIDISKIKEPKRRKYTREENAEMLKDYHSCVKRSSKNRWIRLCYDQRR